MSWKKNKHEGVKLEVSIHIVRCSIALEEGQKKEEEEEEEEEIQDWVSLKNKRLLNAVYVGKGQGNTK